MADRKTVMSWLEGLTQDDWQSFHSDSEVQQIAIAALALLKEQDNEAKRIMKAIWDTLHEGFSIDTIADQDWVYEQIRHRIEDI